MKKAFILLLLLAGFNFSCKENLEKEIVSAFSDGTTMKEHYYKWFGNTRVLVKEIRYFPDATKEIEGNYNRDSKKHGKWTYWHDNGRKWLEENYNNNIKDGEFTEWYKSGEKNYEGNFKNGAPHGKWTYWNDDGKKIMQSEYENGKKVKEEKFEN